ncbi:hypothetical protein DPMN_074811 [Dreissena polymorpha]|uniref:Uncharacterized protein n=1 Tax=Dreissena polymorpha TaxID=45954 RepID=A0A9D3YJB8_DREPO|nr:hypothetical protein DPMN_074811 [Dreissena polymorpha]
MLCGCETWTLRADTGLLTQMSPKTAPVLMNDVKDQLVRPDHKCNTYWPTRDPLTSVKQRRMLAWSNSWRPSPERSLLMWRREGV